MEKTKIEKLYDDDKSKGFVNHLIHAYLPVSKPTKVFAFEDNKPKHNCSVCNHELIDAGTILGNVMSNKEYMSDTIKQMREEICEGKVIPREEKAVIKHITHGAILAWTGEKTTTFLSMDCIKDLLNLVTNGLMSGDKNISYQINKLKRTSVFDHFISSPALQPREKEEVKEIQKRIEVNKKHVVTLGDLGVLQQLKEKMEKEEKSKE